MNMVANARCQTLRQPKVSFPFLVMIAWGEPVQGKIHECERRTMPSEQLGTMGWLKSSLIVPS